MILSQMMRFWLSFCLIERLQLLSVNGKTGRNKQTETCCRRVISPPWQSEWFLWNTSVTEQRASRNRSWWETDEHDLKHETPETTRCEGADESLFGCRDQGARACRLKNLNLSESIASEPSPPPSICGCRASPVAAAGSLQPRVRMLF